MKILYIKNVLSNTGATRVAFEKALYLNREFGYDVTFITDKKRENAFFEENSINLKLGVLESIQAKFGKFGRFTGFTTFLYFLWVKRFIIKEKIDVVILVNGKFVALEKYSFLLKSSRTIVIEELHLFIDGLTSKNKIKKYFQKKIRSWLDAIVVLSQKGLDDNSKLSLKNIEVIPNYIKNIKQSKGQVKREKRIIASARLHKNKNLIDLITAWNVIHKNYPDWKVEIYGEGAQRQNLQNRIDELGLQDSFTLKGFVKDIEDKYLEGSFLVMTSKIEGFPLVILEAMSHGMPVISYDIHTGPSDIINNGEDGFLVEYGNIEQLVSKMEELISNEEKLKIFGENAKRNVKRFSQEVVMAKWKKLFEKKLNNIQNNV